MTESVRSSVVRPGNPVPSSGNAVLTFCGSRGPHPCRLEAIPALFVIRPRKLGQLAFVAVVNKGGLP